ncbi:hypothetical protein FOFC_08000 [Fusarium oxysporum]|nr:hypothetical protein FOFC_08000 [Fusarium oxysporum]
MTSEPDFIGNESKKRLKRREATTSKANMCFKNDPRSNSSHFTDTKDENDLDSLGAKRHPFADDPDWQPEQRRVDENPDDGMRPHQMAFHFWTDTFSIRLHGFEKVAEM